MPKTAALAAHLAPLTFLRRARLYLCIVVVVQIGFLLSLTLPTDTNRPATRLFTSPLTPPPLPKPPEHKSPTPPASPPTDTSASRRDAFLRHLHELQHPPDCRTAPLFVFLPTPYTSGLGSQMRIISNSLLRAVHLRRTFILDAATSAYVHPRRCASRSYACLFAAASNCTAEDALADLPPNASVATRTTSPAGQLSIRLSELPRVDASSHTPPRVISGRASCCNLTESERSAIDARLGLTASDGAQEDASPSSLGWLLQQAASYLARPNAATLALADEISASLGLTSTPNLTDSRTDSHTDSDYHPLALPRPSLPTVG